MLINSVGIILREVLEASLIMSVLLALSHLNQISRSWCIGATIMGLIGATLYAVNLATISSLYDGLGQEIVNICLYVLIFIFVLIIVKTLSQKPKAKLFVFSMVVCVAAAIVREGSEIIIYLNGFSSIPELFTPVLIGGAIGAGIGLSVGVFFYYLIINLSAVNAYCFSLAILILVAGGLMSQMTQLLLQADLVPSQSVIWDTSWLVSEHSLVGQILFALMGYEATPTMLQVVLYVVSIVITTGFAYGSFKTYKKAG